jgi:hypothetical protein
MNNRILTLPTDSAARKEYPMASGCLAYFPSALAGVAKISKLGNDKHNPGQPLHHARGKSSDHADCILRHLTDTLNLLAAVERNQTDNVEQVLIEVSQLAWRALAYSQELHEKFGAPLAPGAKLADKSGGALSSGRYVDFGDGVWLKLVDKEDLMCVVLQDGKEVSKSWNDVVSVKDVR